MGLMYSQITGRGAASWHVLIADVPQYALVAVADNDNYNGMEENGVPLRQSAVARGTLTVLTSSGGSNERKYSAKWSPSVLPIIGHLASRGRGMELSTLQYWREGHLYTCDDRTGIVYELVLEDGSSPKVFPRFILADGDGSSSNSMRCEWSTLKGDFLHYGCSGMPWGRGEGHR